jgi:hypothetical protein
MNCQIIDNNEHYVYVFLDTRKPGKYKYGNFNFDYEPFYVGKGTKDRCRRHISIVKNNKPWQNEAKCQIIYDILNETKDEPIIVKVQENMSILDANSLEIQLIEMIGRTIKNSGPLTNVTAGGEGNLKTLEYRNALSERNSGEGNPNYGNRWNDEQRQRASQRNKGKTLSEETKRKIGIAVSGENNGFYGKQHSEETKNHLSKIRKGTKTGEENHFYGKTHSEETKKLIKELGKLKGKFYYTFKNLNTDTNYENIMNIKDFMEEHNIGSPNNLKWKGKNTIVYKKIWQITKHPRGRKDGKTPN